MDYNNVTSESEKHDMNLGKETETMEFKKTTGEMKEAMISISSILNTIISFSVHMNLA